MSEENKWDGIFMNVIQAKGNIDGFFECIFSFLRRQTDFFSDQKQAEKVIVNQCKIQFEKFQQLQQEKLEKEKQKKEREEARKLKEEKEKKDKEDKEKKDKEEKEAATVQQKQAENVPIPQKEELKVQETKPVDVPKEKKDEKEEKPPLGNGGKTDKYIWTQTLEELHMYIYLDKSIASAKQLKVQISTTHLYIGVIGQPPIIDADFTEKIHEDDTIWTLEDGQVQNYNGKHVHLTIEKWKNEWHWWDSPIKGDPKIDTQKIQPESSNLSDLDGETRGTVEKMMFDMRQKQMGLPSSDELQKRDKLKDFMSAHPEMDFSKCKFN